MFLFFKKNGCHTDEIWSYGLANGYYRPFMYIKPGISIDEYSTDTMDSMHQWLSGKDFLDYITVQQGEQFDYVSVYSNQTYDHHPPLYYFLLHTVCSFFPDQFSWGFGYFLNCIFLIVTQIFLFLLGRKLTKSDMAALMPCFFYAGTIGALSTFIFIRQYSLLTMLSVMFVYYCACFFEKLEFKKNLIPVLITAFCCFMTHYYGIIFVGAFTACMCLYLLLRRCFKKMFAFGGSMAATLGLYFAVYPASVRQMLGNQKSSDNAPFELGIQLRIYIGYITRSLYNFIYPSFSKGNYSNVIAALVIAIIIIAPLCFLFRKETWFHQFLGWLRNGIKAIWQYLKNANYIAVFSWIASFVVLLVVNKIVDFSKMGVYSLRYLFNTFPFWCLVASLLFMKLFSLIPKIKRFMLPITAVATAVLIVAQNISQECLFLFPHIAMQEDVDYMELLNGKNCVCIVDDKDCHRMGSFSLCLSHADNIFITNYAAFQNSDLQSIKEKNLQIDYVLSLNPPEYTDAEWEEIKRLQNSEFNEDEELANMNQNNNIHMDDATSQKEQDRIDKPRHENTEIINALNDSRGYEFVAELNWVNGYVYLTKIH